MDTQLVSQITSLLAKLPHFPGEVGARLQLELLRDVAKGGKPYISTIFGFATASIALIWVAWEWVALWYLAATVIPVVQLLLRRHYIYGHRLPKSSLGILLKAIMVELPLHMLWLAYVPMCWVSGDLANNAYLVIFLLGSVTISTKMYGPCYMLVLPTVLIYVPFVIIYTLDFGSPLANTLLPVLQLSFLLLLAVLSFQHFCIFRESVNRRFTIEALVKKLVAARDDAERANHAKSAFLASMSHELRTPLNAIIGFSDMMRQGVVGPVRPPKYQDYAEDIYVSGQHLLTLINDVLDLSKIEAGKRDLEDSDIRLPELVHSLVAFIGPQALKDDIRIKISVPANCVLTADARAVRQILLNFLSNAVKFSSTGGQVELFARVTGARRLILGVRDHGIGMDEAGIKKALEPYGQVRMTTPKNLFGTGLGLPISKALAEAHGAAFRIDSAIGRGTMVWADFPAFRVKIDIPAGK